MNYVVGAKGRIVIPKAIRTQLGIQPGWIALQRLVDDHLEIYFVPPEHRRSLKGSLAPYVKAQITPEKWWDSREKAWAAEAKGRALSM
jgi:AbrB family looped-hinge helix DNA binding protein